MWRKILFTVIFTASSFSVASMAADIHQWRDKNGNIHFGDKPPVGSNAKTISITPNVYASPSTQAVSELFGNSENVILYSAVWCGYCTKARNYFNANDVPFKEYDIEKTDKGRRDYKRLKAKGVPVILVGNQRLNGFSTASFNKIYQAR